MVTSDGWCVHAAKVSQSARVDVGERKDSSWVNQQRARVTSQTRRTGTGLRRRTSVISVSLDGERSISTDD